MKIGMALSGGGYRATVFHLGVLSWLARSEQLDKISFLSTVSGGSIAVGLIFAANSNRWPNNQEYSNNVVPKIRKWMTRIDLQNDLLVRAVLNPLQVFQTRADDLAELMEEKFEMLGTMQDLPSEPRWIINTTCYESGKLFRISRLRMGDYSLGYVKKPRVRISEAVAASAGFPIGIGPLEILPRNYDWFGYDENGVLNQAIDPPNHGSVLHLWDGGVYDNLADEPLFDPSGELRSNIDFLVVSDASGLFKSEQYHFGMQPLKRLLDIAVSQIRAVRTRTLVEYMDRNQGRGMFLRIGNPTQTIVNAARASGDLLRPPPARALSRVLGDDKAVEAAEMATHIHDLKTADFDLLFRHGFEAANATHYSYVNASNWLDFSA